MSPRRLALALVLAACGGGGDPSATPDAPVDAAPDSGGFTSCEGACRTTDLTAALAATRTLDHAVYGVTSSAGGATLHVEVYRGGDPGCPEMSSPPPDYTLVLGRVPVPAAATPVTSPANILDFVGDLLGGPLGAAATAVAITPTAYADGAFLALDVDLTFAAGSITGHLFAEHCASLDSTE